MAKRLVDATAGEREILREIGHGPMGAVYLAKDISLSRRVAIKVVAPHLLSDEGMISRLWLEVWARNPLAPFGFTFGEFAAQRLAEGDSVRRSVRRQRGSPPSSATSSERSDVRLQQAH